MTEPHDPTTLGLMRGFPPATDQLIRTADGGNWRFPQQRWAFSHQRELYPTVAVRRGAAAASPLPVDLRDDLDAIAFTTLDGQAMTWGQAHEALCTDGVLVLHRGRVVYERYFGALSPARTHIAFSVTKSFVGLIAEMLVEEGLLDPDRPVPDYVAELQSTAYDDARVRQVMDMTIGVAYSEDYTDPGAGVRAYSAAVGLAPRAPDYAGPEGIFAFLQSLQKQGEHGHAFAYKTCNTEVLGWIIQRITNTPMAQLISERIWQKLGVEEDADLLVDKLGAAMCGGGLNTTLRDLARFGEMMRMGGAANGHRIAPEAAVARISAGADKAAFAKAGYQTLPGWSYRSQWWVSHDNFGSFTARGIHGQAVWIAPRAELVIARYASHPTAGNANGPLDYISLPAYAAVAAHLAQD
jgi:hypothetical protein